MDEDANAPSAGSGTFISRVNTYMARLRDFTCHNLMAMIQTLNLVQNLDRANWHTRQMRLHQKRGHQLLLKANSHFLKSRHHAKLAAQGYQDITNLQKWIIKLLLILLIIAILVLASAQLNWPPKL